MQRFTLPSIAGVAWIALAHATPAAACSDLPNICQMNAQHHQNMMDIAATPPWSDGYDDSYDGGNDMAPSRPPLSAADWERLIEAAKEQDARNEAEHQRKLAEDPVYARFYNGYWLKSGTEGDDKDRACMVHFTRKGQGVVLAGPGGQYGGAVLSFYGYLIPKSKRLKTITMTLRQDDEPPQQVRVYNGKTPWLKDMGMVHFAVPDINAAISGMTDEMTFDLAIEGEQVLIIKWHGGNEQRDLLRSCVDRQKKLAVK